MDASANLGCRAFRDTLSGGYTSRNMAGYMVRVLERVIQGHRLRAFGFRVWGSGFRDITPITGNQTDKKM